MDALKISGDGLNLDDSPDARVSLPTQAFALSLSDSVIEDMIKCVQGGEQLELALGNKPTLHYGSKTHRILPPDETAPFELYLTQPFEDSRTGYRIPQTDSLFESPENMPSIFITPKANKAFESKPKPKARPGNASANSNKGSSSSGLDSGIEELQNTLADINAKKEHARMVDHLPASKKGAAKLKDRVFANSSTTPRSLPVSPALNGMRSPSQGPELSVTEQALGRTKEQRFVLVHELAIRNQTREHLLKKWDGDLEGFKTALQGTADEDPKTGEWAMKKARWRELDVWKYDFDSQEDRQKAIDNAVRQFDRQRLSSSEPEWEKLLPKSQRGQGICLSKIQANLARGPTQPAPKIKVQKADGESTPKDETDATSSSKSSSTGEKMSRTTSNPLPTKMKKVVRQEAPAKKPPSSSTVKTKAAAPKPSPSKTKAAKPNGTRILSQEFIEDSDSTGDEAPVVSKKPQPTKPRETVVVKPAVAARKPQAPSKRPLDESDSSSSSGTPLAKRLKMRPAPASNLPGKSRPSDAKPAQKKMVPAKAAPPPPPKHKNTSPTKSSPLASSPPTNASDIDEGDGRTAKKRKVAGFEGKPGTAKRRVSSISSDVIGKAQKFRSFYSKYEALHHEISALENPTHNQMADLLDMRNRLQNMKREIYAQYETARA